MRNNTVFIAFNNKNTADSVAKMILSNGEMQIAGIVKSVDELTNYIAYYNGGIIVCGFQLGNLYINEFVEIVPKAFSIIMIGSREQIEICESDRVFKLSVPLQKNDLICSLDVIVNVEEFSKANVKDRTFSDDKIINRAKTVLIDNYFMNEEQAYKYIQQKSMTTGMKMVDIARRILSK